MKRKSGVFILLALIVLLQVLGTGLALGSVGSSYDNSSTTAGSSTPAEPDATLEVYDNSGSITIKVNGEAFEFTGQKPYISSSRTMVPLSFVAQALGALVNWNYPYLTISEEEKETHIQLKIGDRVALLNGGQALIDVSPAVNEGTAMVPLSFISQALGAEVKYIKITKWTDQAGNIIWPANDGFKGEPVRITLHPGTRIDRYGSEYGTFVCPEGVPYEKRSLAPGSETKPYNVYAVLKPVEVQAGEIAPWFDQPGGGTQYMFDKSIRELIEAAILKKVG